MAAVLEAPAVAPEQFPRKLWARQRVPNAYCRRLFSHPCPSRNTETQNRSIPVLAQDLDKYINEEELPVDEMLLVVEVSDSTLRPDLSGRVRQYGSAGIPEYWVADIPNWLFPVFREPTADGYVGETILTIDDEVRPLATPNSVVRVAELLP